MGRNETLGKGNQIRPLRPCLGDQGTGLGHSALPIEMNRGGLNGGKLDMGQDIAHDLLPCCNGGPVAGLPSVDDT
jgi:hypothetical protein